MGRWWRDCCVAQVHSALMAQEGCCELYVRLLCQYEPRAVLPFLQSHTSYRCRSQLRLNFECAGTVSAGDDVTPAHAVQVASAVHKRFESCRP